MDISLVSDPTTKGMEIQPQIHWHEISKYEILIDKYDKAMKLLEI